MEEGQDGIWRPYPNLPGHEFCSSQEAKKKDGRRRLCQHFFTVHPNLSFGNGVSHSAWLARERERVSALRMLFRHGVWEAGWKQGRDLARGDRLGYHGFLEYVDQQRRVVE